MNHLTQHWASLLDGLVWTPGKYSKGRYEYCSGPFEAPWEQYVVGYEDEHKRLREVGGFGTCRNCRQPVMRDHGAFHHAALMRYVQRDGMTRWTAGIHKNEITQACPGAVKS